MSYRSSPYDHHHESGRGADGWGQQRPQQPHHSHTSVARAHGRPRPQRRTDYTLAHAGRQVRLGPVAFWIVVGSLVVMAVWSAATGTYFAFHDDVLKRLISRQAEMQYAYEDRIAELRAQVDRITSRQMLDQEQFEQKLEQLLRRQATLEQRSATLSSLPDQIVTGSIKPSARPGTDTHRSAPLKPSPINDTVIFTAPPDREARLESRPLPFDARRAAQRMKGGIEGALARLSDSLDRVETRQVSALATLEENYDNKARRIRGVLTDLGLNLGKETAPPSAARGVGGPFVPLRRDAGAFERQLYRVTTARAHVDRLTQTLAGVPVRKPVFGEIDMTSPFGMRMDPFLGGPAIHTGIDMRGDTGDPVRATANGKVTVAGPAGGYGKMVEIDHGHGLTTRYGHLSAIEVKVGQTVRLGQVIGRIGSTGRSTGPHLHYETRIDGEAVNPEKFLRAGLRLGTAL
jgi:murein DD-endopeptidase MepM/ murein hydrolase activator NlpD